MALTATILYPSSIPILLIILLASQGVQLGAFHCVPSPHPHADPTHTPHLDHLLLYCLRSSFIYCTSILKYILTDTSDTVQTAHLLPDCLSRPYATPSDPLNEQQGRLRGGQAIATIVSNSV